MSFFFPLIKSSTNLILWIDRKPFFCFVFSVLISAYLCFSTFILEGLVESCVTFLLHFVLDCLRAWEVCAALMPSWLQEDQTAVLSFLWQLETWLLFYQDSYFGLLRPYY